MKKSKIWVETLPGVKQPTIGTTVLRTGIPVLLTEADAKPLLDKNMIRKTKAPAEPVEGLNIPLNPAINAQGSTDVPPPPPPLPEIIIEPGFDLVKVPDAKDRSGYKLHDREHFLVIMPSETAAALIAEGRAIDPDPDFFGAPVKVRYTRGHAKAPDERQ